MGIGIKVGVLVTGVCGKVLAKGDFDKSDRNKTIRGVVKAMVGTGRARKWTVLWDNLKKMSTKASRSLEVYQGGEDSSEGESSSSSDQEDNDGDDSDTPDPTGSDPKPTAPSKLDPHGLHWERVDDVTVDLLTTPKKHFSLKWRDDLPVENRTPADFFWLPTSAFEGFMQLTNIELEKQRQRQSSKQEFFTCIGLLFAMCVVDYGDRRSYWSGGNSTGIFPKPNFGKYGVGINRFETILRCLRCAPRTHDDKWADIRAVVNAFNSNRVATCDPSWSITVDEKTSSFRPMKGVFCDDGPPTLTKIIRKPKPVSLELKDVCDAETRVCLQLELQEGKDTMSKKQYTAEYNAGTAISLRLTKPWFHTGRCVNGDSAFASVQTAVACSSVGLHFTGLVKKASKKFPKAYLSEVDLPVRGDHAVCISNPTSSCRLLAVAWNGGKKRKLIVSTCGVTTLAEAPASRTRYKNVGDGTSVAVKRETPWPQLVRNYFHAACACDVNNHYRQGSLAMEESWGTHTWWHRVLATVLGTIEADAYLAYVAISSDKELLSHRAFVEVVSEALIFNDFAGTVGPKTTRKRSRQQTDAEEGVVSSHDLQLLSSVARMPTNNGPGRHQKTCRVCRRKTSYFCTACSNVKKGYFFGICGPGSGRGMECFNEHRDIVS